MNAVEPPAVLNFTDYFTVMAGMAATVFAVLAAATQVIKQTDSASAGVPRYRHLAVMSSLAELVAASLAAASMLLPNRVELVLVDARLVGLTFAGMVGFAGLHVYLRELRDQGVYLRKPETYRQLAEDIDRRQLGWSWLTVVAFTALLAAAPLALAPDPRAIVVAFAVTWLVFSGSFECFYYMNPNLLDRTEERSTQSAGGKTAASPTGVVLIHGMWGPRLVPELARDLEEQGLLVRPVSLFQRPFGVAAIRSHLVSRRPDRKVSAECLEAACWLRSRGAREVLLMGVSLGGSHVLSMATSGDDSFCGYIAVCGEPPRASFAPLPAGRVLAFFGTRDKSLSRTAATELRDALGVAGETVDVEAGHDFLLRGEAAPRPLRWFTRRLGCAPDEQARVAAMRTITAFAKQRSAIAQLSSSDK